MPEWHQYKAMYAELRKSGYAPRIDPMLWTGRYCKAAKSEEQRNRAAVEYMWYGEDQPFYNVWPAVAEGFANVTLDVPTSVVIDKLIQMPAALSLRFTKGQELEAGGKKLRAILAGKALDKVTGCPSVGIWVDTGDTCDTGLSVLDYMFVPVLQGKNVSDGLMYEWEGFETDKSVLYTALRVLVCTAMVKDDPDFVQQVVLKRHEGQPDAIAKARKEGVVGFHVGRDVEVGPHYRRAHFAIRWTGKGRTVAALVPIRGCMVKGHDITQVPTGYET